MISGGQMILDENCTVNGTGGVHHDIPPTSLINNFTHIDKVENGQYRVVDEGGV